MKKDTNRIFIVLALYAMAAGIFYNFQELWMIDNNLSVKTIGIVYSLCSIITASTIFLCSNLITKKKLKGFINILLIIKFIVIFLLFILNKSNLNIIIKFLIMVDYAVDTEIYICIYPLLALINKDNKTYAKKDIIYDTCYYLGIFLTSILIGKKLFSFNIDYNFYLFLTLILIFGAILTIKDINITEYINNEIENNNLFNSFINKLKHDKISLYYLIMTIFSSISYYLIMGMFTTIATNIFSFSPSAIANFRIILGLFSVIIGFIILQKLTFKKHNINITIKFGGRTILYLLAFICNIKFIYILAILYTLILKDSYTHITDAPYINRVDNDYQLILCNSKAIMEYIGRAFGIFLCGILISIDVRYIYLGCGLFGLVALLLRYYLAYLYNKEVK